ncbi:MAG: tetratricopeptide repeat protein [Humidesulfovibrio sp.]|nr:tetratricopeptide repeat protein [Humidesulfovibrio sp.]
MSTIGTGTTARKTEALAYFFVQEDEAGNITAQALGQDNELLGKEAPVTREQLLERFLPDPQRSIEYAKFRVVRQQTVQKAVARGDKFLKHGAHYSAEFEYNKALALEEENVRANFGIGLCYIARGERDKAREVFDRLVGIEAAFEQEHKHLFNEFGIRLRMSGMYDEALAYYSRALGLCPEDENLHYNMARAAFGQGEGSLTVQHLDNCLRLNPVHQEALQFLSFLVKHLPKESSA